MTTELKTTCPYCGVGCGVIITHDANGDYQVKGDKSHPANQGRLCSKGSALAETLGLEDRALEPIVHGDITVWDSALNTVANQFKQIIDTHGPDAVAFYVSGQLLTEDYYLANKLMKGFIGSANIDTNSRLCMSSSVVGHKRAFGSDTVPGCYEDFEQADLIILTGTNAAWCHPVLYQRIVRAKKQRPELKVVVIDPRETATCDIADLHLALKPGTDSILFDGLLQALDQRGERNNDFIRDHTDGVDEALRVARWFSPSSIAVAEHCGLPLPHIEQFYDWFITTPKTITAYSQGIHQTSSGSDKVNAIINCHLFTGRIGHPGMGPFSLTGQPNAMGGREVGALANQLAAHMDIDNPQHRDLLGRFWNAPQIANKEGLKAVDLFRAVESGQIKALWIMGTNPAVSMPDADRVRRALAKCEFLVVSDCMENTDTVRYADVLLPAKTWGEKEGTVTNSERRISRQRAFIPAPGKAKSDWWIISQIAQKMGYDGFDYPDVAAIFKEHARLTGFENNGERGLDLSGLSDLSQDQYQTLTPTQWPIKNNQTPRQRRFSDGRFDTLSGRARFIPVTPTPPVNLTNAQYPFVLNTGRVRDHWHTMTRTGKSVRLSGHISEPFLSIHPQDAAYLEIEDRTLVQVGSAWGDVVLRADITPTQQKGSVFAPMHWSDIYSPAGRIGPVVNPVVDPLSGQPEFKHTPVRVVPYRANWHGFVLSRRCFKPLHATYWARARRKVEDPSQTMWHYELAGEEGPDNWANRARTILCGKDDNPEWMEFFDASSKQYRAARMVDGRLDSVIFIGPGHDLPSRDWIAGLFQKQTLDQQDRKWVLAGYPGPGQKDEGRIVCSCFGVGINTLTDAIKAQNLQTPEAIGEALSAGTNCGSCIPELRALIHSTTST